MLLKHTSIWIRLEIRHPYSYRSQFYQDTFKKANINNLVYKKSLILFAYRTLKLCFVFSRKNVCNESNSQISDQGHYFSCSNITENTVAGLTNMITDIDSIPCQITVIHFNIFKPNSQYKV